MIKFILAIIISISNLLAQEIRVGLEEFPPLVNSATSGYTIDLLRAIEKDSNYKFKIEIMTYGRAKKELKLSRVDIMGHTPKTFEQSSFYEFAQDLDWEIPSFSALFVKNKMYFNLEKIRYKRIGTLLGNSGFFSELLGMNTDNFMEVRTIKQLVLMLEKERLDAIIFERVSVKKSLEQLSIKNIYDKPVYLIPIGLAVAKNEKGDKLKKDLDNLIKNINYYGIYIEFLDK